MQPAGLVEPSRSIALNKVGHHLNFRHRTKSRGYTMTDLDDAIANLRKQEAALNDANSLALMCLRCGHE